MMPLQELLREALARFQLRRSFRRTEHRPSAAREFIHDAQRQRQLRPYHSKIRTNLLAQRHE